MSVALSTANPPHTLWTISIPTYGIADSRSVITCIVAPQNDICPRGSTYPMNVVAMVWNRITTPTDHVYTKLCDSQYSFRPVCK